MVVPYVHGFKHNHKKIAPRQSVFVAFSAPEKAHQKCRRVSDQTKAEKCDKNHCSRYADCNSESRYYIPLLCRKVYTGQTGRCINDRAKEHAASLKTTSPGPLTFYCRDSRCTARIDEIGFTGRKHNRVSREIIEALSIDKKADTSHSSEGFFEAPPPELAHVALKSPVLRVYRQQACQKVDRTFPDVVAAVNGHRISGGKSTSWHCQQTGPLLLTGSWEQNMSIRLRI
ncbi:hypothetical protein HPB48_004163 [Haemaphysalis longicornis]|uniref:Tick transposon n=1 Tax=Haemaphysalis longicornis TaxID=44386 RepID=A0A9J6GKG3_HAELO|nr:hypothetical protein HPB48_004163 [Haemaphysalis longicornis]